MRGWRPLLAALPTRAPLTPQVARVRREMVKAATEETTKLVAAFT